MKTRNCRRALPVDTHRTTSRTEAVIVDVNTLTPCPQRPVRPDSLT